MGGWSKGPARARQGEKANKQRGLWRKLPAFAARARVCVCFLCICIVVLKKSFFESLPLCTQGAGPYPALACTYLCATAILILAALIAM